MSVVHQAVISLLPFMDRMIAQKYGHSEDIETIPLPHRGTEDRLSGFITQSVQRLLNGLEALNGSSSFGSPPLIGW